MTQISGETNNLDLYSEARDWCGIAVTDTTTLPLVTFIRSVNFGLDRVNSLILRADGRFQFNDINNTGELLDVTSNLVSGTQKYAIALNWLKIGKIRIKDSAGNWVSLIPVDRRELTDSQLTADAGDPKRYDKLGNYIYLHPKPNYSSSGGLEVQFQQGASHFAYNATTTVPGFDSDFHILVALYGARDYCEKNGLENRANAIRAKIGAPSSDGRVGFGLENELMERYSSRDMDSKITLKTQSDDYGQSALGSGGRSSNNIEGWNI